jgi:ubiquinone/menaquinone biosynthesis C-methylase UbiE
VTMLPAEEQAMHRHSASDWSMVDRTAQPAAYVGYLDAVHSQDTVRAYKEQTYELLDLHPGDRVIDVGCGAGDDVLAMGRIVGPSGRVVGMDASETMIEESQRRSSGLGLPVEFVAGYAHNLDFAEGSFDAARADRVFQHLEDPKEALAELIRVTRPGGRIVVTDPDWGALIVDGPDRETTQAVLDEIVASIRNPWMGRQLLGLFQRAGLAEVTPIVRATLIPDFPLADHIFHLSETLNRLRINGKVTNRAATNWIKALEAAHVERRFCCSLTAFTVFGRRL